LSIAHGLRGRIAAARTAARRAVEPKRSDARPASAAWALVHLDDASGGVLDDHAAHCTARGFRCLVLSDRFPPGLLGRPEIVFEFLPVAVPPAGGDDVPEVRADYLFRRLAHIVDFWDVVGITWEGERAAALRDAAPPDAPAVIRGGG
jgi:hypothetical protein